MHRKTILMMKFFGIANIAVMALLPPLNASAATSKHTLPLTDDELVVIEAMSNTSAPYAQFATFEQIYEHGRRAAMLARCDVSAPPFEAAVLDPSIQKAMQADISIFQEKLKPPHFPADQRNQWSGALWAWRQLLPNEQQAYKAYWQSPAFANYRNLMATHTMLTDWLDEDLPINPVSGRPFAPVPAVLKAQLQASSYDKQFEEALQTYAPELLSDWQRVKPLEQHTPQDNDWLKTFASQLAEMHEPLLQKSGLYEDVENALIEQSQKRPYNDQFGQWVSFTVQVKREFVNKAPLTDTECSELEHLQLQGIEDARATMSAACAIRHFGEKTDEWEALAFQLLPRDLAPQTFRAFCEQFPSTKQ